MVMQAGPDAQAIAAVDLDGDEMQLRDLIAALIA
jgi:hypothetical protein